MKKAKQETPEKTIEWGNTKPPSFLQCIQTDTSLSYNDKIALQAYVANETVEQMLNDAESLALAEENLMGEYQRIIENFLEEKLGKLNPEQNRTIFQFFRVTKRQFLPQIINYAIKLRRQNIKKDSSITLEEIINKWKKRFNRHQKYKSLDTNPRIPQKREREDKTQLGISRITSETRIGIQAYDPTTQRPTERETKKAVTEAPNESFNKKHNTIYGLPIIDPTKHTKKPEQKRESKIETKPRPNDEAQAEQSAEAEQSAKFEKKNFPTIHGVPSKESTDVHPIVKEPDNQWEKSLSARDREDIKRYRNLRLTISQIYTLFKERSFGATPTKTEWEITLRNFHTAMIKEFDVLKKEILNTETSNRPFNEDLQQKTLDILTNALRKVGSPQFRKTVIHAFYNIFKDTKRPETRAKMAQMLHLALTERDEFKKPIKPSEKMQRIHRQCELKPPKKAHPKAFTQAFSEFNNEDLTSLPQDLQPSIKRLLETARKLGINTMPMSGMETKSIASMTNEDFEMMCYQTLNQLRIISERIGGKLNPSTWRGPRKKARKIMKKLTNIIQQEIITLEQLLYSQTLFIPEEVQRLNQPNRPRT